MPMDSVLRTNARLGGDVGCAGVPLVRRAFHLLGVCDEGACHEAMTPAVPPPRIVHQLQGSKPCDARRDTSACILAGGETLCVVWSHGLCASCSQMHALLRGGRQAGPSDVTHCRGH